MGHRLGTKPPIGRLRRVLERGADRKRAVPRAPGQLVQAPQQPLLRPPAEQDRTIGPGQQEGEAAPDLTLGPGRAPWQPLGVPAA